MDVRVQTGQRRPGQELPPTFLINTTTAVAELCHTEPTGQWKQYVWHTQREWEESQGLPGSGQRCWSWLSYNLVSTFVSAMTRWARTCYRYENTVITQMRGEFGEHQLVVIGDEGHLWVTSWPLDKNNLQCLINFLLLLSRSATSVTLTTCNSRSRPYIRTGQSHF